MNSPTFVQVPDTAKVLQAENNAPNSAPSAALAASTLIQTYRADRMHLQDIILRRETGGDGNCSYNPRFGEGGNSMDTFAR